jgi:uncharacterized protein
MKSLFSSLLFFSFSLISNFTFSQSSILWEVSGGNLTQPSYLLGTLKFMGEKEYKMPPVVERVLKSCSIFAIEDEVDHHAQHELNKTIHFPKGQSLASVLSAEDYARVQVLFQNEFNVSKKVFTKKYAPLTPLALSITMTRLSLHEGLKYYDIELLKMAKYHGLEAYSLEPIDREAQAIRAFAMPDQVKALLLSINNFQAQADEYKNLEAAYIQGDIEKVFEYTFHPFESNEAFIEEFYTKRNKEWLPKLEKMFSEQRSFVAVGVSHLEGENGLLNLMKSKGYTLTAIPLDK